VWPVVKLLMFPALLVFAGLVFFWFNQSPPPAKRGPDVMDDRERRWRLSIAQQRVGEN
jgi:hypothetical protein